MCVLDITLRRLISLYSGHFNKPTMAVPVKTGTAKGLLTRYALVVISCLRSKLRKF